MLPMFPHKLSPADHRLWELRKVFPLRLQCEIDAWLTSHLQLWEILEVFIVYFQMWDYSQSTVLMLEGSSVVERVVHLVWMGEMASSRSEMISLNMTPNNNVAWITLKPKNVFGGCINEQLCPWFIVDTGLIIHSWSRCNCHVWVKVSVLKVCDGQNDTDNLRS